MTTPRYPLPRRRFLQALVAAPALPYLWSQRSSRSLEPEPPARADLAAHPADARRRADSQVPASYQNIVGVL